MKVYEGNGEGGLIGVTKEGRAGWFGLRTTPDVFIGEGKEIYVVVKGGERSPWMLDDPADLDATRVQLYNTHCTGELRWDEVPSRLTPDGLLAVKHFKLVPADLTSEEWQEVLDSHTIKLEDISDVGVEMLRKAAAEREGCASFVRVRSEETGREQSSEMYTLHRHGLVNIGASMSSGEKTRQLFHITGKGRTILKEGKA